MKNEADNDLKKAITKTVEEFKKKHGVTDAKEINAGLCEEFADEVAEKTDEELTIQSTADITGQSKEDKPDPWHIWIFDGEQWYDAEHPEGVDSWAKLNFFQRITTKDPHL